MKSMILFACFLSAQAYAGTCRLASPVSLHFDEMGRHDYTSGKVDALPARFADYPNGRLKIRVAKVSRGDGGGASGETDLIAASISDGHALGFGFAQVYNGGKIDGSISQSGGEQVYTFTEYRGLDNQFKSEFRMTRDSNGRITSLEMWLTNGLEASDHVCVEDMSF